MRNFKVVSIITLGIAMLFTVGFGYMMAPSGAAIYTGGRVEGDGEESHEGWINGCDQLIHDCWVQAFDHNNNLISPESYNITVKVEGEAKSWEVSNDPVEKKKKLKVSGTNPDGDCCNIGKKIQIIHDDPSSISTLLIQFTNPNEDEIKPSVEVTSGATVEILQMLPQSSAFSKTWALALKNSTDFLICGFSFSNTSTVLTMSEMNCARSGPMDLSLRKIEFEFPLEPNGGKVVIGAKYASYPAQTTSVTCSPIFSKVIPESDDFRQTFIAGQNISVPDIILNEAEAGIITTTATKTKIILKPRNQFEFQTIGNVTVTSGNIQLGTASIVNGQIHIGIVTPSYGTGKSEIKISNIEIKTLTGLVEGTISVRQEVPNGNNSNFKYAYFQPETD